MVEAVISCRKLEKDLSEQLTTLQAKIKRAQESTLECERELEAQAGLRGRDMCIQVAGQKLICVVRKPDNDATPSMKALVPPNIRFEPLFDVNS